MSDAALIEGSRMLRDSRDIIRRLLQDGFEQNSVRGSHHKFVHQGEASMVIVPHPKRDLPRRHGAKHL